MTKEEEMIACLKLSIHFTREKLDSDEKDDFIDYIKTFDGKDEYTKTFFSTDDEIVKAFPNVLKSPSDLDESVDGLPGISSRTWLECCCYGANGIYEGLIHQNGKC